MTLPARRKPRLISIYEQLEAARARGLDPSAGRTFDPSESPWHRRAVFVVGAPRSGTTWLHQMLACHPDIATAGETHLFDRGLGTIFANHNDPSPFLGPHAGLVTWATYPELVRHARIFADGVFSDLRDALNPAATMVLDKTPNHPPHASLLAAVFPDGRFIHLLRDGRDSAASSHDLWSWDDEWRNPRRAARNWVMAVEDVRAHLADLDYLEVRYEALAETTDDQLVRILEFLELPMPAKDVRMIVEFTRTPVNLRPSSPEVGVRKWAGRDSFLEREITWEAAPLLRELGYVNDEELARLRPVTLSERAFRQARRALSSPLGRRTQRRRRTRLEQARRLADALTSGDAETSRVVLHPAVQLVRAGVRSVGSEEVSSMLFKLLTAHEVVAIDADAEGAGIRCTDRAGRQVLLTCSFDRRARVTGLALTD